MGHDLHPDSELGKPRGLNTKLFEDLQASFGELQIDVEQAIATGERILLITNEHNRGAAGGGRDPQPLAPTPVLQPGTA